jgi:tetratricopeptide (TPR) repeat protein
VTSNLDELQDSQSSPRFQVIQLWFDGLTLKIDIATFMRTLKEARMRNASFRWLSFISIAIFFQIQTLRADFKQAVAYYNQGQYAKAIQEMKPELDKNPDWEPGYRILGLSYLGLGDNANAISFLTQAIDKKSTAFSTYFGLAQAYFARKEYDNCIGALNKGDDFAAKEKVKLFKLRGAAYFKTGNFNDAVSDLTNAIRLDPSNPSDFAALGAAYLNLDRVDEGIEALEKSLSMKAGQSAAIDLLGKAYFKKGVSSLTEKQYAAAVQHLMKAKDYDPKNGYIYYRLAEAYLFQKKYPEAEKALNQTLELLPNNADAYERKGLVYEKQKKWDLALSVYKKADQINPSKITKESIARVIENRKIPDQGAKTR